MPKNHTSKGKGKEKQKDQGERKEERRKTVIIALLVFSKKGGRGLCSALVFKNPAGLIFIIQNS